VTAKMSLMKIQLIWRRGRIKERKEEGDGVEKK
jgi:hypothetical protein